MSAIRQRKCGSCGHEWLPRKEGLVPKCPKCKKLTGEVLSYDTRNEYIKEYSRKHYIGTTKNGVFTRIRVENKRDHPKDNTCEVCGSLAKKLGYHHWDDSDYSKGLWLCYGCHLMAECCDKGHHEVYLSKKSST